jgi:antitoxin CptB
MGELDRVRWQCRRSMLELDIAIGGFCDARYESLEPDQQEAFLALLAEKDQDLLDWLFEKKPITKPELEPILNLIRQHAGDY